MSDGKIPELEAMQTIHKALQPLRPDSQKRVLDWVVSALGISAVVSSAAGSPIENSPPVSAAHSASATAQTIEAFVTQKQPKDTYQRLACLAYYLEFKEKKVDLSGKDLTKANTDARQAKIANIADFFIKAEKRHGYFTEVAHGKKRVSARGKAVVEALPSQEGVKQALQKHPLPKGGGRRAKPKKPPKK
jgi:hypothetical protein